MKIRVKLRGKLGILCSHAKLPEFRGPFAGCPMLINDPKNIYNITKAKVRALIEAIFFQKKENLQSRKPKTSNGTI